MTGKIRNMTLSAFMAAVLCIIGPVVIPIGIIPFSLSTIGIYLMAIVMNVKNVLFSIILYLLIGLLGVPVFSGFSSGPGVVLGPTGGYLIAYIPAAMIVSYLSLQARNNQLLRDRFLSLSYLCILSLGNLLLYCFGSLWLTFSLSLSFVEAIQIGVLPFVIPDFLKIFIVVLLAREMKKRFCYEQYFS